MRTGYSTRKRKREKLSTAVFRLALTLLLLLAGRLGYVQLSEDRILPATGTLEVHFIDVGQGDATLLISEDKAMLIDAGENDQGTRVWNYLRKRGIGEGISLEYCIGTHPDSDHIGGMDVILNKFPVEHIFLSNYSKDTKTYREVLDAVDYYSVDRILPKVGESYTLGDAVFTIVAPNREDYDDVNNGSVGVLVQHGGNRMLFLGDCEEEAEEDILQNGVPLQKIDLYKVSHHGSSSSSSEDFIEIIEPEYAVISVGEDNSYGHPHAEVLNRLRKAGTKLFRTDEQGSIVVESDGENLQFNTPPTESWQSGR